MSFFKRRRKIGRIDFFSLSTGLKFNLALDTLSQEKLGIVSSHLFSPKVKLLEVSHFSASQTEQGISLTH